jgi:cell division transport system permease protein
MALMRKTGSRRGIFRQPLHSETAAIDRIKAYLALQMDSLKGSFARIWETPIASSLTILVVAIALALPASFNALIQNARQPVEALETTSQISLFLKPELSNEVALRLANKLKQNPALFDATLITKEDGLRELAAYSGFGDALAALNNNPLPAVILLRPRVTDADSVSQLLVELKTLSEADKVQFDSEWLQKLQALLAIAQRCVTAFSLLLGFGVLFTVGNTIRLELQNRRDEIAVAQLLGATHRFIRRPFIHSAFWYAFLGAILAWGLANLLILAVQTPANQLAELYNSPYRLSFLRLTDSGILFGSAILLGITGAWIVVAHFLREIDSE